MNLYIFYIFFMITRTQPSFPTPFFFHRRTQDSRLAPVHPTPGIETAGNKKINVYIARSWGLQQGASHVGAIMYSCSTVIEIRLKTTSRAIYTYSVSPQKRTNNSNKNRRWNGASVCVPCRRKQAKNTKAKKINKTKKTENRKLLAYTRSMSCRILRTSLSIYTYRPTPD